MADNIPGGAFWGFHFATPVDYLVLDGELVDGFGIDNIEVVWTTYTDSDSDGFTETGGIVMTPIPMSIRVYQKTIPMASTMIVMVQSMAVQ